MRVFKYDPKYRFYSIFNDKTGYYMRSGVLRSDTIDRENDPMCTKAVDTGKDPFMASFPELIDVGIMGSCIHGREGLCLKAGVQCYQNGREKNDPNMLLSDFRRIAEECKGKVFTFALGGAGDPDQHENFEEILQICRNNRIVPTFTTSGYRLNEEKAEVCKKYCGAVAVSWYRSEYTYKSIELLLNKGVKTNIHYVVGNNTIEEAIRRLKANDFPKGINAIVFLLHKPIGLGEKNNSLKNGEKKVKEFFEIVDQGSFSFKIGFDSCFTPGLINHCDNILEASYDSCEGARWSMYISADMVALPCSFDNQNKRWGYDIKNRTIQEAWDSEIFEDFRRYLRNGCGSCNQQNMCMGGCPICPEIVLCQRKDRCSGKSDE